MSKYFLPSLFDLECENMIV